MSFPDTLGTITCRCVIEQGAPVLFVSRAGDEWQMYCSDENHDFEDPTAMKRELTLVHVAHLVALDHSLNDISDLAIDMGAVRDAVGAKWTLFENSDNS